MPNERAAYVVEAIRTAGVPGGFMALSIFGGTTADFWPKGYEGKAASGFIVGIYVSIGLVILVVAKDLPFGKWFSGRK